MSTARNEFTVTNTTDVALTAKVWNSGSIIKDGVLNLDPNGGSGKVSLNPDHKYILTMYLTQENHNKVQNKDILGKDTGASFEVSAGGTLEINLD